MSDDRTQRRLRSRSRSRSRHRPPSRSKYDQLAYPRRTQTRSRSPSTRRGAPHRTASRSHSRSPDRRQHSDRERSRSRGRDRSRKRSRSRSRSRSRDDAYRHKEGESRRDGGYRSNRDRDGGQLRRYHQALASGLDSDHHSSGGEGPRKGSREWRDDDDDFAKDIGPLPPSNVVHIGNLPRDVDEKELRDLFAPIPGMVSIRIVPERGFAFMDMVSVDAAKALLDSAWRDNTYYHTTRLQLNYAKAITSGGGGIRSSTPDDLHHRSREGSRNNRSSNNDKKEWICGSCKGLNFSWRVDCYQCGTSKADAGATEVVPRQPSHSLKIGNVELQLREEDLEEYIKPYAPVKSIRLARYRDSCKSKGFGFADFYSIEDATNVLNALDGTMPPGQLSRKISLSFAVDISGPTVPGPTSAAISAGGARIEAALESAGWQPKAFDEAAAEEALAADPWLETRQPKPDKQQPKQIRGSTGNVSAPAGYVYDADSGYKKDPISGVFYDANTGFYFHPQHQEWGNMDEATGRFTPYAAAQQGLSSAAEGAVAASNAVLYATKMQQAQQKQGQGSFGGGQQQQQQQEQQQQQQAKPKRSGAVIGAAAQLDPQGLLEAARAAEEKALLLRKHADMQEEKRIAAAAAAAGKKVGEGAGAAAGGGGAQPVQGVIHKGKWAQRRQQIQLQQQE